MSTTRKTLLVGLGHPYRSDDGFGPRAIEVLKEFFGDQYEYLQHSGDPADLMDCWDQRSLVIIDAIQTPDPKPGTVHSIRPLEGAVFPAQKSLSSHALSLMDALELGRILQKLPKDLIVLGVEGENFAPGDQLSPSVAEALDQVIRMIPSLIQPRNPLYA